MSVASKNLFDLLGNDADGDSDIPSGPVKTVDKNTTRTTKRTVEPVAPAKPVTANTGARRGPGGNEGAFRDKNAGTSNNQRRSTDEATRGGPRGGRGARERGGRGGRYPRERDDRHTKGAPSGSEKQAAQSWGAQEGEAEAKDEQAGEAIAKSELKEASAEDAQNAEAIPEEEEDKSVSYTEYLAQLAEKKLALGGGPDIRKPNEGSKADKKWASAKALVKEETDFVSPTATKTKRERERKEKQVLDIDQRYVEPERAHGGRGGARGGARGEGGRGRGEGRGGRGRGEGRGGRGRGGGEFRGGNESRGGRGGRDNTSSINTKDESAFPSLGA